MGYVKWRGRRDKPEIKSPVRTGMVVAQRNQRVEEHGGEGLASLAGINMGRLDCYLDGYRSRVCRYAGELAKEVSHRESLLEFLQVGKPGGNDEDQFDQSPGVVARGCYSQAHPQRACGEMGEICKQLRKGELSSKAGNRQNSHTNARLHLEGNCVFRIQYGVVYFGHFQHLHHLPLHLLGMQVKVGITQRTKPDKHVFIKGIGVGH